MKQKINLDDVRIINGDSPEAEELYRELGWYSDPMKIEVKDVRLQNTLPSIYLAVILAWLVTRLLNPEIRMFIDWFLTFYIILHGSGKRTFSNSTSS